LAGKFYFDALAKIFTEKPDLEAAERLLRQSLASDPTAFFVDIQLGNVCVKRGSRACASRAYSDALQYAPNDSQLRGLIGAQIKRVSSEPLNQIQDLRDPFMEGSGKKGFIDSGLGQTARASIDQTISFASAHSDFCIIARVLLSLPDSAAPIRD